MSHLGFRLVMDEDTWKNHPEAQQAANRAASAGG
jgi:formylglycine-generating enzyme